MASTEDAEKRMDVYSIWRRTPLRHKSFRSENELRQFLSERAMHSCFYSTAYWKKPYELKMDDKVWQGADLIFDLDGDHLPGVTDRDFPAMLNVIQEQARLME